MLLKNKFNNAIINHMEYWNIINRRKCNYVLKIAIYLKQIATEK